MATSVQISELGKTIDYRAKIAQHPLDGFRALRRLRNVLGCKIEFFLCEFEKLREFLCFVERELGGPALALEDAPALSEIEERLLVRVIESMVGEWCNFWSDARALRPVPLPFSLSSSEGQVAALLRRTALRGPLRVRALVRVRCPRTGSPFLWRTPR